MKWLKSLTKCFRPVAAMFGVFFCFVLFKWRCRKTPSLKLKASDAFQLSSGHTSMHSDEEWKRLQFQARSTCRSLIRIIVWTVFWVRRVGSLHQHWLTLVQASVHYPHEWERRDPTVWNPAPCWTQTVFCSQFLFRNISHSDLIPSSLDHVSPIGIKQTKKAKKEEGSLVQSAQSTFKQTPRLNSQNSWRVRRVASLHVSAKVTF